MHIKQVLISGFRSFKSQSEIEEFSPKHNVIVGRNGSGKSNFFDAIQFVLATPKFAVLRQEDRQNLLHEGAGSSVMAAYVEIIFDNSDGRLSVDSDEVVLRRTVGHKKDEFFLNRKRVQRSEVVSLLESAGFSKSNPYYICQQGKVAHLCVMKDKDRLNLLKEVAGTTVYEERRSESIKILEETKSKQEKVEEVLSFIEERISELEKEKAELTEYDKLDKQRRAVEFHIYDQEFHRANNHLEQNELLRENTRQEQQNNYQQLRELQDSISSEEESRLVLKQAIDRIVQKQSALQKESLALENQKLELENDIQELQAMKEYQATEKVENAQKLQELNEKIREFEGNIAELAPLLQARQDQLAVDRERLLHVRNRMEGLYAKQGRGNQFTTQRERDEFLSQQIAQLQDLQTKKQQLIDRQEEQIRGEEKRTSDERRAIDQAEAESKRQSETIDQTSQQITQLTGQRNQLQERRKMTWKALEQIQEKIQDAKNDLERGKQQLSRSLSRSISQGLLAVEQIVQEHRLRGYFGPLIDNFSLSNAAFQTVIEVAAGQALFNIVVETEEIAAFLIKELEKRNAGRLTFLPLSKLRVGNFQYPETSDVAPIIDVAIQFDAHVEPAMRLVFGGKLIAPNLEVAHYYSKESKMDCYTMDGDIVNYRGAFEGGFRDERFSKVAAVLKIRSATEKLQALQEEERQTKTQSDADEKQLDELLRELQRMEVERDHARRNISQRQRELQQRSRQIQQAVQLLQGNKQNLQTMKLESKLADDQIKALSDELRAPFEHQLSETERAELRDLEEQLTQLQRQVDESTREYNDLRSRHQELQDRLTNVLLKEQDELKNPARRQQLMQLSQARQERKQQRQQRRGQVRGISSSSASAVSPVRRRSRSRGRQQVEVEEEVPEEAEELGDIIEEELDLLGGVEGAALTQETDENEEKGTLKRRSLFSMKEEEIDAEIAQVTVEYEHIQKQLDALAQELSEVKSTLSNKEKQLREVEVSLDAQKSEEKRIATQISENTKLLDKLINKKSMYSEQVFDTQRKIRDLGALPKKEVEDCRGLSEKQLLTKLREINLTINQYPGVNRKALDQYLSFTEQRESLLQRKQELDKDFQSIQQLIQQLDIQKDEAILRTFRGVSKHFSEVFQELVPAGQGKLVMRTTTDDHEEDITLNNNNNNKDDNDSDESEGEEEVEGEEDLDQPESLPQSRKRPTKKSKSAKQREKKRASLSVSAFTGVQVQVQFAANSPVYQMQQLSGGQKAVVALALVFAIQRCDPAPFYLFDEIDQALDANYRTAVANLIHRQANSETAPAQFITTTFRPELVAVADRWFGIALTNKMSNIYSLEKADAEDFVTNLMLEEEAVGKVSAVPSFSKDSRAQQGIREEAEEEEVEEDELEGGGKKTTKAGRRSRHGKSVETPVSSRQIASTDTPVTPPSGSIALNAARKKRRGSAGVSTARASAVESDEDQNDNDDQEDEGIELDNEEVRALGFDEE